MNDQPANEKNIIGRWAIAFVAALVGGVAAQYFLRGEISLQRGFFLAVFAVSFASLFSWFSGDTKK